MSEHFRPRSEVSIGHFGPKSTRHFGARIFGVFFLLLQTCFGAHVDGKAGHSKLNLYQLVQLLRTEASLADVGVQMTSEGSAARLQRKKYKRVNTYMCDRWGEYGAGTRSAASLLRACSHAVKHYVTDTVDQRLTNCLQLFTFID